MYTTRQLSNVRAHLILVGLLALAGCDTRSGSHAGPTPSVQLHGAGSTFVAPLFRKWFDQYRAENPAVDLQYDALGSFEGTKRFLRGDSDFAATDAALTTAQIEELHDDVWMIPVTAGAITLAYNVESLPPGIRLSRDAYVNIFLGKITRWDDPQLTALNPTLKLPGRAITVVVRRDGSGTTFAFTNHLAAVSPDWKKSPGVDQLINWPGQVTTAPGNEGVANEIQRTPGAIGYVEYGIARAAKLAMARLENKSGAYVEPTPNSGLDSVLQVEMPSDFRVYMPDPAGADSYPIVTFSWMLTRRKYDDPQKDAAIRALVRWCLNDGQRYSESLGYIRLPPHIAQQALAAVESTTIAQEKSP